MSADAVYYQVPNEGILHVGKGVNISLEDSLRPFAMSKGGRIDAAFAWSVSDTNLATIVDGKFLLARAEGTYTLTLRAADRAIGSADIPVRNWRTDRITLAPPSVQIPLGMPTKIVAEVHEDEESSTAVLLEWKQNNVGEPIVRFGRSGLIWGDRIGHTVVSAGAGDYWAARPVEVDVIGDDARERGPLFFSLAENDGWMRKSF